MMADSDFLIPFIDPLFSAFQDLDRYEEPGRISSDGTKVQWGWGNWNPTPPPEIFQNGNYVDPSKYVIDPNNTGFITFTPPVSPSDEVRANYQIRLFPTTVYDAFFQTALSSINAIKPQTIYPMNNFPPVWLRGMVLLAFKSTCQMLIPKMATFKYRRLFEDPDNVMNQLRANSAEATAEYSELKSSLKRRGETLPVAIADFNRGKMPWRVDESNFSNYAVLR